MYIAASFEHHAYLELALTDLEQLGIPASNILAIPLNQMAVDRKLFDSIHHSDGDSLFDGAAVLGTIVMMLGVVYGRVLTLGPILCGLIGLFIGALIGFALDLAKSRRRRIQTSRRKLTEVILLIHCSDAEAADVESILWQRLAIGVGRYEKN